MMRKYKTPSLAGILALTVVMTFFVWLFNEKTSQNTDARISNTDKVTVAELESELESELEVEIDLDIDIDIEMVFVRGGTFWMGCTAEQGNDCLVGEKPAHEVTVGSFNIGKYSITQAQWQAVMDDNPSHFKGESLPVEQVSWNDAQKFISRLNAATGKQYRLPKEAEWEYAARGGDKSQGYKYSGSNNVGDVAWYEDNSDGSTHPVGRKQPNELGIYDMSGNVWEWCNEKCFRYPDWKVVISEHRLRGGSWERPSERSRLTSRGGMGPDFRWKAIGFRVALSDNWITTKWIRQMTPHSKNAERTTGGLAQAGGVSPQKVQWEYER